MPIEGAQVTLHSNVQEAHTDATGRVVFENVETGPHRVLIAYQNFEGEQALYLTEDKITISLQITVTQRSALLSPLYLVSMGGVLLSSVILTVFVLKLRSQKQATVRSRF